MKSRPNWHITPIIWLLSGALVLMTIATAFWSWWAFGFALTITIAAVGYTFFRLFLLRADMRRFLRELSQRLNQSDRSALESTPLATAVVSETGEFVWYNALFRQQVLNEKDVYGLSAEEVFDDLQAPMLTKRQTLEVRSSEKSFLLFVSKLVVHERLSYVLYCVDNTELRRIATEYEASRPVLLSIYIDNSDEVMQNLRASERAQLSSQVETLLEDWIAHNNGLLRKTASDRFTAILEQRYLPGLQDSKFDILDKVRTVQTAKGDSLTLSIGVGCGDSFYEAESRSRQALDMALGRGGDQAALKTQNGFDFYGGLAKSVERQTRVRSRVVASALHDLILNSDRVLLMGHRYSDLDCLGASVALAAACQSVGKPAQVVYDPQTTLAGELIARFEGQSLFITADDALPLMEPGTLLIISDTHSVGMLDAPKLYEAASSVVVIDHHRKMVNHIEDAVIFYHEPFSSSASEMVAELVQHMAGTSIGKRHAEALLAGIMLDTRSFVMKAGVRTFEAAAYLRKLGADTVEVKRLFSENISLYQRKAEIVSTAEWYKNTAIAYGETGGPEMRVAASQAADELLCVRGVDASFAMFSDNGGVNISARSYGAFNVQLVMEALGGGGHLTMAGAFLKDIDLAGAQLLLKKAIDRHLEDLNRSKNNG